MPVNVSTTNAVRNKFKNLGLDNPYLLVSTARKGIKPKVFYDFAEAINMPEKSLAGISLIWFATVVVQFRKSS